MDAFLVVGTGEIELTVSQGTEAGGVPVTEPPRQDDPPPDPYAAEMAAERERMATDYRWKSAEEDE